MELISLSINPPSSRHPSVSGGNGVRPVGSVFLLRAAPDVADSSLILAWQSLPQLWHAKLDGWLESVFLPTQP